ncbi:hypothetical protein IMCC14465_00590 [alpha proteobacterium IMCC14465]|uniref:biotin--[biotin carboxyl-carrier protein] ligase n=1 Tax=alpha proteobacterium IMCC14465 TaxID=1220535 RepID=J9A772_9PROT|nr:hypothetical protein IMCC14465_00590 [alpha proteobacterium IMCC14465]
MTMAEFPVAFPPDFPEATALIHLTQTGSTNDEARRLFAARTEGDAPFVWIMTDRQVSGRGRMGRNWSSPEGNLMTSLMCKPSCDLATMGQLGFVAGLAVQASIQEMTSLPAKLKWPNDVLIEGAKCAGILLETLSDVSNLSNASKSAQEIGLAIGIGVNLQHHPTDTPYPAISLTGAAGVSPSPREMITVLARHFNRLYGLWMRDGFSGIRLLWLEQAYGVGEEITAVLTRERQTGTFKDIDAEGRLLLEKSDGSIHLIAAGDIFFGATKDLIND